jgi:hypothetical protein
MAEAREKLRERLKIIDWPALRRGILGMRRFEQNGRGGLHRLFLFGTQQIPQREHRFVLGLFGGLNFRRGDCLGPKFGILSRPIATGFHSSLDSRADRVPTLPGDPHLSSMANEGDQFFLKVIHGDASEVKNEVRRKSRVCGGSVKLGIGKPLAVLNPPAKR